ncbi:YccF domain-containing protein [Nocardioides sp. WV_118_6]|uniref:YccF domain-containing protein n=1 Tax=Nocardioides simplex TaxID=2045 RepID=UPI00215018CD|nr:YccF domain-containing protein [Pimelobacter simplex]UUW88982.1 YccF domain-containing protein [Pimelobacter simplex]UUW98487.1 YccF domain-containing protein [Pimelobacter simplex]
MRLLLNIIWLVLAGFWMCLGYLLAAALWCITIIGIPFGVASYRIGMYALWPFGREVVKKPGAGVGSGIGNVLWFVFSGIWLAIGHAITGVLCCITIIGIPLGLASFKLIPVSLLPLGREIVDSDDLRRAVAAYGRTGV